MSGAEGHSPIHNILHEDAHRRQTSLSWTSTSTDIYREASVTGLYHLHLICLVSKTVRKYFCVVEATQSVVLCYGSPCRLINHPKPPHPPLPQPSFHRDRRLMQRQDILIAGPSSSQKFHISIHSF